MTNRNGDRLLVHIAQAEHNVLLCAPFIKAGVLRRLLDGIPENLPVQVYTRWVAAEIRSGASDLEVFDVVQGRERTELRLYDGLHAKLYRRDSEALIGSANLTATALGWRDPANLELLMSASVTNPDVAAVIEDLGAARPATQEERDRVSRAVDALPVPPRIADDDITGGITPEPWLPIMSAPKRLFDAYASDRQGLLTPPVLEAALRDLAALGIPPGLLLEAFQEQLSQAFVTMPAVALLFGKIERDGLDDDEARAMVANLVSSDPMSHRRRWEVTRDWIEALLGERIEVIPETFITRRRPGNLRR